MYPWSSFTSIGDHKYASLVDRYCTSAECRRDIPPAERKGNLDNMREGMVTPIFHERDSLSLPEYIKDPWRLLYRIFSIKQTHKSADDLHPPPQCFSTSPSSGNEARKVQFPGQLGPYQRVYSSHPWVDWRKVLGTAPRRMDW